MESATPSEERLSISPPTVAFDLNPPLSRKAECYRAAFLLILISSVVVATCVLKYKREEVCTSNVADLVMGILGGSMAFTLHLALQQFFLDTPEDPGTKLWKMNIYGLLFAELVGYGYTSLVSLAYLANEHSRVSRPHWFSCLSLLTVRDS
jgi:hypothetical protein